MSPPELLKKFEEALNAKPEVGNPKLFSSSDFHF